MVAFAVPRLCRVRSVGVKAAGRCAWVCIRYALEGARELILSAVPPAHGRVEAGGAGKLRVEPDVEVNSGWRVSE